MHKKIVIVTSLVAFSFLLIASFYYEYIPKPVSIDTLGQPTIGTGSLQIVLFEDLCCTNCRIFTEEVFPRIVSDLVDTGRARLSLIPVAFGDHSKPLANGVLAVYSLSPDRFIAFLHELLISRAGTQEEILGSAQRVGGIDLEVLRLALVQRLYYGAIDQNLSWAKRLMGDDFGTPSLFVNGVMTATDSFDSIVRRISQLEKQP